VITRVEIDGYKSFLDFGMDVRPCTILMGVNGAGKSNLLDALDFVRRTVTSGFPSSLGADPPLAPRHLFHHAEGSDGGYVAPVLSIKVGMIAPSADGPLPMVVWLEVERDGERRSAPLPVRGSVWVSSMDRTGWMSRLGLPQELREALAKARDSFVTRTGTDWVPLDAAAAPSAGQDGGELLALLHREVATWQSVALDTAAMRRPYGGSEVAPLLADGSNLAAVLHRVARADREAMEADLAALVPESSGIRPLFDERRGEYDFDVRFRHTGWTSPPMLSGGTLRVLALLAAWYDDRRAGVLAVDELENGLHATRLAELVSRLRRGVDDYPDMAGRAARVSGFRQLLATTHSPALLAALRHDTSGSLVFLEEEAYVGPDRRAVSTVTRARPVRERRPGEDADETVSVEQVTDLLTSMGQPVG
jgi:hypothetical protein